MRLIDADALLAKLHETYLPDGDARSVVYQVLVEQPEAVVRCKDCKHRHEDDCPMRFEEIIEVDDDGYIDHEMIYHDFTRDDGFCDRAKRRTDDQ